MMNEICEKNSVHYKPDANGIREDTLCYSYILNSLVLLRFPLLLFHS